MIWSCLTPFICACSLYQTLLLPCHGDGPGRRPRLSSSNVPLRPSLDIAHARVFPHQKLGLIGNGRFTLQAVERNHSAIGSGGDRLTCHLQDLNGTTLPTHIKDSRQVASAPLFF